jgi:hypothetical protein
MELLAKYDESEDLSKSFDNVGKCNKEDRDRTRLTLLEKKQIVEGYYAYLDSVSSDLPTHLTMRSFVEITNKTKNARKIEVSNLGKWIRSEKKGEFLSWSNCNNLNKKVCYAHKIIERIDLLLKKRDPHHAEFNKIVKSPTVPDEYGIVARKFTPAGTFLGYYKGEFIDTAEAESRRDFDYIFCIGKGKFIDAKPFLSCYARYYNCAEKRDDQNVCVERLEWTNPQKAICFITTKDVPIGKEFLISYGCEYWERQAKNAEEESAYQRICTQLMDKVPYKYQEQEAVYSFEAPAMAAAFLDDVTVTEDSENSKDSDYTGSD